MSDAALSVALPTKDFRFEFPQEPIATSPAEPRDSSRLMVLSRGNDALKHVHFRDLPDFLEPGDCVVLNRTKVQPNRLKGRKKNGSEMELLLVQEESPGLWKVLGTRLKPGLELNFHAGLSAVVQSCGPEGSLCRFSLADMRGYLEEHGLTPLPPYILKKRKESGVWGQGPERLTPRPSPPTPENDRERYQTVYARDAGSVAAPTAGLHFTEELLKQLQEKGIRLAYVTLHVGLGTFKPLRDGDAAKHVMLPEWFQMEESQAQIVKDAKAQGRRVVAVGTTATRTLETLARRPHGFAAGKGWSDLYLYPGKRFELVTSLITNFHLPESTPLLLASAFAGREKLLAAYQEAFRQKYRLYSFGDAMLIL